MTNIALLRNFVLYFVIAEEYNMGFNVLNHKRKLITERELLGLLDNDSDSDFSVSVDKNLGLNESTENHIEVI